MSTEQMRGAIEAWRSILDYEYQADRFEDADLDSLAQLLDNAEARLDAMGDDA